MVDYTLRKLYVVLNILPCTHNQKEDCDVMIVAVDCHEENAVVG